MSEHFHAVLPEHIRLGALSDFPTADWPWWHRYPNGKLATVDSLRIPVGCRMALKELARTIAPKAGFWDLDFYGAGLHLMTRGVSLGEHTDASHHPIRPWRRLQSLVYFLNNCVGGELMIGEKAIRPRCGDAVMFDANQLHHVREALSERKTLSLFSWALDDGPKINTSAQFTLPIT